MILNLVKEKKRDFQIYNFKVLFCFNMKDAIPNFIPIGNTLKNKSFTRLCNHTTRKHCWRNCIIIHNSCLFQYNLLSYINITDKVGTNLFIIGGTVMSTQPDPSTYLVDRTSAPSSPLLRITRVDLLTSTAVVYHMTDVLHMYAHVSVMLDKTTVLILGGFVRMIFM